MKNIFLLIVLSCSFFSLNACASQSIAHVERKLQNFSVSEYKVQIKPNFLDQSIKGVAELSLDFEPSAKESLFNVNDLVIDEVKSDLGDIEWNQSGSKLEIHFSQIPKKVTIQYHGKPTKGLNWGDQFVYSAYFTCHWMICDEEPSPKAKFDLTLIVPSNFKTTASGDLVDITNKNDGLSHFHWREDKPYSTYIFGFAAGAFHEAQLKQNGKKLRLLGVEDDRKLLLQKFKDTPKILKFFEEKAGLPLQHTTYTQVLVPGSQAQENNAFAVIGRQELDPILTDPQEDWVIVHEMAHQWWGNLITCKSWQHGWLNEGITVFMTAAYKEQRWDRKAYAREMELAQKRWKRAIDINFDKPLSFAGPYPSLGIQRSIIYSKASLFMDALRTEMGEKDFWKGFKIFTQKYAYQSVESRDFQVVMQSVTDRSLNSLFDKWVY